MTQQSKTKKRARRGRHRLSDVMKPFQSEHAIWHLFGNSVQHALDVLLSGEWQREERRKELLKKIPKALHPRIESLVKQVTKYKDNLQDALRAGLVQAGFTPNGKACEQLNILDLEQGRFGPGTGKLVFNLAHCGEPGARQWTEVGELTWDEFIGAELEYRCRYVTADRHHKGPKDGVAKQLWNLYTRLTPWVAEVAGEKLEALGDEGKHVLQKVVIELAGELAKELGVDVVGAAVHREKHGDLHVHLIFSETREKEVPRKISKREFEALVSATARKRIADGEKVAFKALRKMVREELLAQGANTEKVWERQRRRFPRPIQILGPSFTGKLALWLASGKDPKIAAQGDRPLGEAHTFREAVVAAIDRGEDLGATRIDHWLCRRYQAKIEALLTEKEKMRCTELAKLAVERYRQTGSQTPSIEHYIALEVEKLRQSLPTKVRKDLEKESAELDEREKAIALREQAVNFELPVWLVEMMKKLPKRYQKSDPHKTMEMVFRAVETVNQLRKDIRKVLTKVATMKPADWQALFLKIAAAFGLEAPEGPNMK